jgi:hypothetical protein
MNADARRLKGAAKQVGRAISLLDKELCLRLAGEWEKQRLHHPE